MKEQIPVVVGLFILSFLVIAGTGQGQGNWLTRLQKALTGIDYEDESGCAYKFTGFGACDPENRTQLVNMTLLSGDPALCDATGTTERRCFVFGQGGNFLENLNFGTFFGIPTGLQDSGENWLVRLNRSISMGWLFSNDYQEEIRAVFVVGNCTYQYTNFSDCDPDAMTQSMVLPLKTGEAENCNATITSERFCVHVNGTRL